MNQASGQISQPVKVCPVQCGRDLKREYKSMLQYNKLSLILRKGNDPKTALDLQTSFSAKFPAANGWF